MWCVWRYVVVGDSSSCWGTANYPLILLRGRKIGSRAPGIEPGSRPFETFATVFFFYLCLLIPGFLHIFLHDFFSRINAEF